MILSWHMMNNWKAPMIANFDLFHDKKNNKNYLWKTNSSFMLQASFLKSDSKWFRHKLLMVSCYMKERKMDIFAYQLLYRLIENKRYSFQQVPPKIVDCKHVNVTWYTQYSLVSFNQKLNFHSTERPWNCWL